jgi:hypothetical protein
MPATDYNFSAFDDGKLNLTSKIRPFIKYLSFVGLAGLVLVSVGISPVLFTPGILLLIVMLATLYRLCGQTPGDVFAKQNHLKRPFMKNDSYYYFLYKEYREAADSALSKTSAAPWGLPIGKGELAIAFFYNLDVMIWGRLSKNLPHLVIDATGNDRFLGNNIDRKELPLEQVSLEGNFPDYFKVYMEKGQEVLSLQILSPDRMVNLIDDLPKFDLEIKGDHIKIYGVRMQNSSQSMHFLMGVLQSLDVDLKIDRLNKIKIT